MKIPCSTCKKASSKLTCQVCRVQAFGSIQTSRFQVRVLGDQSTGSMLTAQIPFRAAVSGATCATKTQKWRGPLTLRQGHSVPCHYGELAVFLWGYMDPQFPLHRCLFILHRLQIADGQRNHWIVPFLATICHVPSQDTGVCL